MAKVAGKTLALGFLATIVLVVLVIFWIGATASSNHVPGAKPGVGFGNPSATTTAAGSAGRVEWDGGAIARTLHDRRTREALRQRILQGWAQGEGEVAKAARQGKFLPAPEGADGGAMDPKYIQEVVRSEFFSMAQQCYADYLSRKPDAAGESHVMMKFAIVADETHGGIIEDLEVAQDGGLDNEMKTCMHESFMTVSFRPPAKGGTVTVEYPIAFSPDEPDQ